MVTVLMVIVVMRVVMHVMMIICVSMGELMPSTLLTPQLEGGPPLVTPNQRLHDNVRTQTAFEGIQKSTVGVALPKLFTQLQAQGFKLLRGDLIRLGDDAHIGFLELGS
jgi:hypothetical protein